MLLFPGFWRIPMPRIAKRLRHITYYSNTTRHLGVISTLIPRSQTSRPRRARRANRAQPPNAKPAYRHMKALSNCQETCGETRVMNEELRISAIKDRVVQIVGSCYEGRKTLLCGGTVWWEISQAKSAHSNFAEDSKAQGYFNLKYV